MLDKKDAQWWVLEAEQHPNTAIDLIRMLADRLSLLDKQNEALRGELTALKRKGSSADNGDVIALQQRIRELESAVQQGNIARQLLVYAADRIEVKSSLDEIANNGVGRPLSSQAAMLICEGLAKLLVITAESQAFNVTLNDLPTPENGAALLGNPNNIAVILDQSQFETCRFLTVLTEKGFVYSLLAGSIPRLASKGDKLVRQLIPGDPVVTAVPSFNGDLFAVARSGKWTRFAEKTIAATGSQLMELSKGDAIVGLVPLNGESDLTFITADGRLFIRSSADFKAKRAPGSAGSSPFKGQAIFGVTASPTLTVLTTQGKLLSVDRADLPFKARTETGTPLPGITAGDSVLAYSGLSVGR